MGTDKCLNLQGFFGWEQTLGIALLLMDDGHFCMLHMDDIPSRLLGRRVQVAGHSVGFNLIAVEAISSADRQPYPGNNG